VADRVAQLLPTILYLTRQIVIRHPPPVVVANDDSATANPTVQRWSPPLKDPHWKFVCGGDGFLILKDILWTSSGEWNVFKLSFLAPGFSVQRFAQS
jgi:hypothetical protein